MLFRSHLPRHPHLVGPGPDGAEGECVPPGRLAHDEQPDPDVDPDGAPAEGYRAPRNPAGDTGLRGAAPTPVMLSSRRPQRGAPIGVLTGEYGAMVIEPLIADYRRQHSGIDVRVIAVPNLYFGGNTAVTGLMVGADLQRVLAQQPAGHRYLLPDVCLSDGRFLDGLTPSDLPHPVEVVATDGIALRRALDAHTLLETAS